MKCDAIVGNNTCNLEHSDESGLCSIHRDHPGVPRLSELLKAQLIRPQPKAAMCGCGFVHAPGERCGPF